MLWAQLDKVTDQLSKDSSLIWYVVAGVVAVALVAVTLRKLLGGKRTPPDFESGLREDLSEYPPPPAAAGKRRLTVQGEPVRLRLVVVAPVGKAQEPITPDQVNDLLDEVLRGLGAAVRSDKPRVKVWPPQLSAAGFAPTFHRLVETPDEEGKPSRWVLAAGQARIGGKPVLIGLALLAERPCRIGRLNLEPGDWREELRVE